MSIVNLDEIIKLSKPGKKLVAQNHEYYPQHDERGAFRWLIIGPSGSGKTNLAVSTIRQMLTKFDHLYLYVRDPTQDKYVYLMEWLDGEEKKFEEKYGQPISMYTVVTDPTKIVSIDKLNSKIINLVVFDDMLLEKNQSKIIEYFIRGRHRSANCMYLTQSYFDTPKELRINCDYFSIFGLPSQNEVIQLMKEHSMGMDKDEFKLMFREATKDSNSFLHIDRKTTDEHMRFRKNLDQGWMADQGYDLRPEDQDHDQPPPYQDQDQDYYEDQDYY